MTWPYEGVLEAFQSSLAQRSLVLAPTDAADVLAAALSAQMVFFAGPSGTGKSSVAMAAASLLAADGRQAVIQTPSQIGSEAELFGYASTLEGDSPIFHASGQLDKFLAMRLQEAEQRPELPSDPELDASSPGNRSPGQSPPILVVEEGNLGRIEGYLGTFLQAFSGDGAPRVDLRLHSAATMKRSGGGDDVPGEISIGPWPRIFFTLNVDHTAEPPPRKVAARGLALVFEPPTLSESDIDKAAIPDGSPVSAADEYHQALGAPSAAAVHLRAADRPTYDALLSDLHAAVTGLGELVGKKVGIASPRSLVRAAWFAAAYVLVASPGAMTVEEARANALEFGLLHTVLPALSDADFNRAASAIQEQKPQSLIPVKGDGGGPLWRRLQGLGVSRTSATDFWTAFS